MSSSGKDRKDSEQALNAQTLSDGPIRRDRQLCHAGVGFLVPTLLLIVVATSLRLWDTQATAQIENENPLPNGSSDIAELLIEKKDPTPLAPPEPLQPQAPAFPRLDPSVTLQFSVLNTPNQGGRVAFESKVDGYSRIFVLELQSKEIKPFIDGPGNNNYPTWAPDGTKLAFVSDRTGQKEIFVADWDGLNQRRISRGAGNAGDPAWSPDGKSIVYYREEGKSSHTNLWLSTVKSGKSRKLTSFTGRNSTPAFHPDGNQIAFSTNRYWPGWDVCVWNISTKRERCVLKGKNSYCRPEWTPDGRRLFFSYGAGKQIDIGAATPGERQLENISTADGREYDATLSPNGKELIYSADGGSGRFQIYLRSVNSDNTKLLVRSPYSLRYLTWSKRDVLDLEVERIKASQQ